MYNVIFLAGLGETHNTNLDHLITKCNVMSHNNVSGLITAFFRHKKRNTFMDVQVSELCTHWQLSLNYTLRTFKTQNTNYSLNYIFSVGI